MRTLLLDGDIYLHRVAHVNQWALEWTHDCWSYFGDLGRAKAQFDTIMAELLEKLWADRAVLCLSDSESNWRHGIEPTYKGTRASWQATVTPGKGDLPPASGPQRPMLYKPLRDWLLADRGAIVEPRLEADDLLGLFGSAPSEDEQVIVTVDKDLGQVPGLHYNPDKSTEIETVSPAQAAYNHLYLVLVGDTSDGYRGCPGIGPVKAAQALAKSPTWATVVGLFEKAGQTEADALVQARIARVLQHGDYDFKTGEIRLWTPK